MKTTKRRKAAPRKKKCTCTCGHKTKRKRTAPKKKIAKRKTAKRKPRKTAKRKKAKRKTSAKSSLNGPGNTFRLSSLQRRFLSKPLQAAIIERQRRLGKTIIA